MKTYQLFSMEKTFANATLLSASVLGVFMLMVPINHLSAQNEVKIDEKAKVRKAVIENIDLVSNQLTLDIGGVTIVASMDASTTVFLGNGDETDLRAVRNGADVYVFGDYHADARTISTRKIVIRSASPMRRKSLSRAEMNIQKERNVLSNPTLDTLGLSAK